MVPRTRNKHIIDTSGIMIGLDRILSRSVDDPPATIYCLQQSATSAQHRHTPASKLFTSRLSHVISDQFTSNHRYRYDP
jgi:hypothetical protein